MNARTERQVIPNLRAVYPKFIGLIDHRVVVVARYEPQQHLVALPDVGALKLDIARRRSAHVWQRCLVANDLRDH